MDPALKNSIMNEKRKKNFAESLLGETADNKSDTFSFSLKPKTVLCLVQDCGKIFKRRIDMMKHNIVHLVQKPEYIDELEQRKVNLNLQKKTAENSSSKLTQPVKKEQLHCSVVGCGAVCQTFEGLKEHLSSRHYEFNELIETSDCCTHDGTLSVLESPSQDEDKGYSKEEEVDRMLELALIENHLLKQRLYKTQQAALMYQQYLLKFQKSGLDNQ